MERYEKIIKDHILQKYKEYSDWTVTTSVHTNSEYAIMECLLGLGGELKECMEIECSDNDEVTKTILLRKELGDLCYYHAHLVYRLGLKDRIEITSVFEQDDEDEGLHFAVQGSLLFSILTLQERYKKVIRDNNFSIDDDEVKDEIVRLLNQSLTRLVHAGNKDEEFDFIDVLTSNREKLESRKQRGVISGSGDER